MSSRRAPAPLPADAPAADAEATPSVSIVIVAYNAAHHLPDCLDSIRRLDYPAEKLEVIVVDNGSTDGTLPLLAERYPWVRVLPQERNLGFAEANNVGVAASEADCAVLVNADMRLDRAWLRELVRAYDADAGYVCTSSLILDWEGERVDFAGGLLNFAGHGNQIGYGERVEDVAIADGQDLLFPCGGSMLIDRRVFLEVGGFDPTYFIYFEDVDLGWRLWLLGYRVRLAARSKAYHRGHGTTSDFRAFQVKLLYERNALRTLIKNLDDESLWPLLVASLLLLAERTRLFSGSPRDEFELGGEATTTREDVSRLSLAHLHAVGDVVSELDRLLEERRRIQAARRRREAEVLDKFRRPFLPSPRDDTPYVEAMARVTQTLRLDELFERRDATGFLVLAYDAIGERMAGPGARSWELARAVARAVPVTLAVPEPTSRSAAGITVERYGSEEELERLVSAADVVLLHGHALERHPFLRGARALKVVDLYDPWLFENLENQRSFPPLEGNWIVRRDVDVQRELLDVGDAFVCASERQRDYWLGMLSARDRLTRAVYEADPSLRMLIDVVPYGCPEEPPQQTRPVLKGVHPRIGADDPLILWAGGTWDWFDPLMVLEAFRRLLEQHPRARLYFMGLELPERGVPPQRVVGELRERAAALGLLDRQVLLGDWVPYDERGAYLLEADLAVLATRSLAEVRLAFRSRLLDHFWAGLPTVMTGGDVLAEQVEAEQAGIVVAPGDTEAMHAALHRLLTDPKLRQQMSDNASRLAHQYRWNHVAEPLRRIARQPWRWHHLRAQRTTPVQLTEDAQLLLNRRDRSVGARYRPPRRG